MSDEIKVSVRHLYKIFGSDPQTALEKVKAGMGKGYCLCVGLAYISAVAGGALCRYVGYTIA